MPDFERPQLTDPQPEPSGFLRNLDPRLLTGLVGGATCLVLFVGCLAIYSYAQKQSVPTQGATILNFTSVPSLTPSLTPIPTLTASPSLTPTLTPTIDRTATITNIPAVRFATLSEIKGTVEVKTGDSGPWIKLAADTAILPGTTVLTSENSSVKITLSEGSIVRLSSQTQFALTELSGTSFDPVTIFKLDFGKVWAIVSAALGSGRLEVQMPVGVASVRGSFMSAENNTTDHVEIVTCLEGRCRYENPGGVYDLTTNQQTESQNGGPPGAPHPIDSFQLADWAKQHIPEVATLTPTATPTPTRTPTRTRTPTYTPSVTFTPSLTFTPSSTFTPTQTLTPTATLTNTTAPTATSSQTFTPVPTSTATATAGPAVKLGFVVQPSNVVAGVAISPSIQVAIQDASGRTVTYATNTITLAIGTNPPGNGTLSGSLAVGPVAGVASFSTVSIDKVGTGYTLTASAASLTGVTSATFNVIPASLVISGLPTSVTAGTTQNITVTAKDGLGNTATGYTGTVAFTSTDGQAVLPSNYTYVGADNGVHTFSVTLKTAGSKSVTATDTVTSAITVSASSTVAAAAAAKLGFIVQPSNVVANASISPSIQVAIQDAFGNTATGSTDPVTLAIGTNPGSGTLSGTLPVTAIAGIATFSNISINNMGTGYTLVASATGLTSETSTTFNVT